MSDKLKFLFDHDLLSSDRAGPYSVEIDPTNHCPIGCTYCIWADMRQREASCLSDQVFSSVIEDLVTLGVAGLVLTGGGEPLSHPFTRHAIARAKSGGMSVGLFTSGVPLGVRTCAEILPHLSWIRFNLSAADRESYKRAQGVDAFESVTRNIRNSVKFRAERNLNVRLGVGCVINRSTLEPSTIGTLAELAVAMKVDFIQFKHDLTEIGIAEYEDWWESKVLPELRLIVGSLQGKIKIEYSEQTYSSALKAPCFISRNMASIKADGTVVLCKLQRDTAALSIGNVNIDSFQQIWVNARRQRIIRTLEEEGCGTCCAYKEFNRYVQLSRQSTSVKESQSTSFALGHHEFGDDLNFL